MKIRKASIDDLNAIMDIYHYAQDMMAETGNASQWGHSYPTEDIIKTDIDNGCCHVICGNDKVHAVFAIITDGEPDYDIIEKGSWLNDNSYIAVHRVASDGKMHGIVKLIMNYCKEISADIRIDTHHDNKIMQGQLEKNGFVKCGVIYVRDGSPRIAYHWSIVE
ncbi:N-acetyltransferase [Oribacterium sp. C9]|uniref:N-acetyltransferase n=1 Tax=Oribacterium sp. C9 TaxID=1943579 RepID=UPI00098F82DD|nr:N-acetyltransferase [Oribacterium sp. C9]OON84879.1 N-acetyltransferase [Oribacterium sp. C9]